MEIFSNEDQLFGANSYLSRQILDTHIKKFRVSDDFSVVENVVLAAGEVTPVVVRLDKKLFPEVGLLSTGMMKHLEISMRSCFAQSGIHMLGNMFDYISYADLAEFREKGFVDVSVSVINRGLSPVEIQPQTPFLRLYFRPSGSSITGKDLYNIIEKGKIKIEGEYGKTWVLVGSNIPSERETITPDMIENIGEAKELTEGEIDQALTLKLKLNGNIYIPDNHKGILIQSKKNLVDVLQPFDSANPQHTEHNFNIGETFYVDFGEYFGTIIYQRYDGSGHHIISPLIDPGFKGPIRTEIVKGNEFNDFIELHIYHKDG
ncbi:hypothetical protein P148_SR1C00001G0816 [candidate division SR1 bacterium RAAC1_SR1_1]|nr:hypothetical protein P148_SR1C00001G0816 [candidate division SR1 bacterium RAAC1_SR1_1]